MNIPCKYLLPLAGLLFGQHAWAYDTHAMRNLQMAISQCERGLQSGAPQSAVALEVLKRYAEKYRRYRDAAFAGDAALAQAKEMYSGEYFKGKPYQEVYAQCDAELAAKLTEAEAHLARKLADDQAKTQARAQLLETKVAQAKLQVATAINRYCAEYMQPPALDNPAADLEAKLQSAESAYQAAKQSALDLYPAIVQEAHKALLRDPASGQSQDVTQPVQAWFDHCDKVFPAYRDSLAAGAAAPAAEESAGAQDQPPVGEEPAPPPEAPLAEEEEAPAGEDTPPAAEEDAVAEDSGEADAGMDEEFQNFVKSVKGDRVKVLQDEGRMPDYYPDNEDHPEKANTWEFESEAGGDKLKCRIYKFKADKLADTKDINKECP